MSLIIIYYFCSIIRYFQKLKYDLFNSLSLIKVVLLTDNYLNFYSKVQKINS